MSSLDHIFCFLRDVLSCAGVSKNGALPHMTIWVYSKLRVSDVMSRIEINIVPAVYKLRSFWRTRRPFADNVFTECWPVEYPQR